MDERVTGGGLRKAVYNSVDFAQVLMPSQNLRRPPWWILYVLLIVNQIVWAVAIFLRVGA